MQINNLSKVITPNADMSSLIKEIIGGAGEKGGLNLASDKVSSFQQTNLNPDTKLIGLNQIGIGTNVYATA